MVVLRSGYDGLVADQRMAAPVLGDEAEQPMLDLVPLAGARREMADLQASVPSSSARPCSDLFHSRVRLLLLPPPSAVISSSVARGKRRRPISSHQRRMLAHGELGRVVVDAHADPAFVVGQVVDAVGNRLAQFLVRKVVDADFFAARPCGCHSRPAFLKSPTNSFFFVSTEIDRLLPLLKRTHLPVDVLELGIAVRDATCLPASCGWPAGCSRASCNRRGHGPRPDRMVLPRQFRRQVAVYSCRSSATATPDRRASPVRQRLQRRQQPGSVAVSGGRPPPGRRTRYRLRPPVVRGWSSSRNPAVIVGRDRPVARATSETPPQPSSRASAAAHCRRRRSSISGASNWYFRRSLAIVCVLHARFIADSGKQTRGICKSSIYKHHPSARSLFISFRRPQSPDALTYALGYQVNLTVQGGRDKFVVGLSLFIRRPQSPDALAYASGYSGEPDSSR